MLKRNEISMRRCGDVFFLFTKLREMSRNKLLHEQSLMQLLLSASTHWRAQAFCLRNHLEAKHNAEITELNRKFSILKRNRKKTPNQTLIAQELRFTFLYADLNSRMNVSSFYL